MQDKQIAFKCVKCGKINILSSRACDGHRCKECLIGGLIPIGYVGIDLGKAEYPRSNRNAF